MAVLLLLGAISNTEQVQAVSSAGFLQADSDIHNAQKEQIDKSDKKAVVDAQQKAMQAAAKAKESWQKVQQIASAKNKTALTSANQTKEEKESKPPTIEKVQVNSTMDVKTGNGLVVQVEATKKPMNANKLQELAAMEEALKKATEEAHRQRVALAGSAESSETSLSQESVQSKALQELKRQQEAQQ